MLQKAGKPSDLKITEIKCGYIRGGHSLFCKNLYQPGYLGIVVRVWMQRPGTYHLVKMFGERIKKAKSPLNPNRLFEDLRRGGFFEGAQAGMYVSVFDSC